MELIIFHAWQKQVRKWRIFKFENVILRRISWSLQKLVCITEQQEFLDLPESLVWFYSDLGGALVREAPQNTPNLQLLNTPTKLQEYRETLFAFCNQTNFCKLQEMLLDITTSNLQILRFLACFVKYERQLVPRMISPKKV